MIVRVKMVAAILLLLFSATAYSQTLFTYGEKSVSKDEFLKAFNKNNTGETPTDRVYRNYLDLYINFKLKVQAALDKKLDTLPNQQAELTSFRSQVVDSYMKDDRALQMLTSEAFQRSQMDIRVQHIFVGVTDNTSAEAVKKAEEKINKAWQQLESGQDFEKVALQYSEDPAVKENEGVIGFITVFSLPYQLEEIVYSTKVGKYSKPVRSKAGFHILKNMGERRAIGKIKAAQILLSFPPAATDVEKQRVKKLADSVYRLLQNKGDFAELAARFSGDNITYQTGGEMMEFGVGQYEPSFEQAAFALDKDGNISKPVPTSYGYHIIKRLKRIPVIDDSTNTEYQEQLKQQVQQSDRMEVSRKIFVKSILELIGFKKYPVSEESLWKLTDSVLQNKKAPSLPDIHLTTALFVFKNKTVTVADWQKHLETIRNYSNLTAGKTNGQLLEEFVEAHALDYYRSNLESYNEDFAFQMNEFREGNLLFEIMQRTIWDVAANDSTGLQNYYNSHRNKYWWEASADAIIITASNQQAADEAKKKIQADYKSWQKYLEEGSGMLIGDSGRFELNQVPVLERTNFTPGLLTASVKNETDNSVTFSYIIKVYNNREPRSFTDARGYVINDYQGFLEDQWIAELKKKYPVKVDESVFKSLPK